MNLQQHGRVILVASHFLGAALCLTHVGCSGFIKHTVPADRLPPAVRGPAKSAKVPINFALLRQEPPPMHLVGPGDMLGIYVHGVVPAGIEAATPVLQPSGNGERSYYPPGGSIDVPNIGLPIAVQPDGSVLLPLIEPLPLQGLTLQQASDAIHKAYVEKAVVQPGREHVFVTLIKPRVHRVLVIREDVNASSPTLSGNNGVVPYAKRGDAHVVDLPAYENDILHALVATGGLPGIDAYNEAWILRAGNVDHGLIDQTKEHVDAGNDIQNVLRELQTQCEAIRIPFWLNPNEPLPFGLSEIVLRRGDVVFIQARTEFFYTGGLLRGGQVPLPRDHDVDVIDAISMAGGSVGRTTRWFLGVPRCAGPGFIIPPTRAFIIRQLPDGQQVPIRVDLAKAMYDPMQRIVIEPRDVVILKYKPGEMFGNVALNFVGLNFSLDQFLR